MLTSVYVDGFNLYYGALRKSQFKWLDIAVLVSKLLPDRQIRRIRYFTALVRPLLHDPGVRTRQEAYLRALKTIPDLTIHFGHFASNSALTPQFPLAYHRPRNPIYPPQIVSVLKTEEKGSDVNLATYLLSDCFDDDFDDAAILTNDSDLCLPIQFVVNKYQKPVTIINPHPKDKMSRKLISVASHTLATINKKALANSQFPSQLTDAKGRFHKPARW